MGRKGRVAILIALLLGLTSAGCLDEGETGAGAGVIDTGPNDNTRDAGPDRDDVDAPSAGDASNADSQDAEAPRDTDASDVADPLDAQDADLPDADREAIEPVEGETRVFVTSQKYDGALEGLAGGDEKCQALAGSANLAGQWLAWLGDGTDGPATRFVRSTGAYRLVGGEVLAVGWDDLVDGTLNVPIQRDETGTPLPDTDDMIVWTAVFHTGGDPTPVNCEGWTRTDAGIVPTGRADRIDTGWTVTAPYDCGELHRLYCFEQ